MQQVLDELIAARALIADRTLWAQGHYTVGTLGAPVQRCAYGAMAAVTGRQRACSKAYDVLEEVSSYYFGAHVVMVNDWHRDSGTLVALAEEDAGVCVISIDDHANVMFIFDKAIAGVRAVMADVDAELEYMALEAEPVAATVQAL